jgi:hypothetical protein
MMTTNPNPEHIPEAIWQLWENRPNPAWQLSGIWAPKKGYHESVNYNKAHYPTNYSIQLPLDLKGPFDKSRAIDLTMSPSEMILWTKRMRASALDPNDNRLAAVKEFYGTLDGKTVFGLSKDSETGVWRRSSADNTHLWHGHTSCFTFFVDQWNKLKPILSVWAGSSLTDWRIADMLVNKGDTGEEVRYWQALYVEICNKALKYKNQGAPSLEVDGDYGDATARAFKWFALKNGAGATYMGDKVTYWVAMKLMQALAETVAIAAAPTVVIDEAQIAKLVNTWLAANVHPDKLMISGQITGKVTL